MLIEFRVANFRSFDQEQTLSLVASKDEKHPDNLIPVDKFNLLKTMAMYGPNASGKSNLIKAISFVESFIRTSATKMTQGDRIEGIRPFRLSVDSRSQPSFFEVTFIAGEIRYQYGFSATTELVHHEWLIAYPPNGRGQRWFERRFDPRTKQAGYSFRGPLKSEGRLLKEKTRDNGLILSRGAELNVKPLSEVFLWFRKRLWVLDLSGSPIDLMRRTAKRAMEDRDFQKRVTQMLRHADLGIDGIKVAEQRLRLEEVPREAKKAFLALFSEEALRTGFFSPGRIPGLRVHTSHRVVGSDLEEDFDIAEDESNGTQRFFALAYPLLQALDNGEVVVVDELDCSMHPLLTRKLIELFQSPEANKKGAQLIFATHDSTLMDPELLRRDQICLVEKKSSGASEVFSLYDFDTKDRPRNTEAFQRNYLAGRYGGVPKFGPIFEDLEIR